MRTEKSKKILSLVVALSFALSMVFVPSTAALGATIDYGKLDLYGLGYGQDVSPLVPQDLDFTENPVDIPNPDRGFYRPQSYVIPVNGGTPGFPTLSATITGTTVSADCRIIYMEFDLRNFSSNAPLNRRPLGPWSTAGTLAPDYGTTQPITPAALDYIRAALQRVRDSEAVAIVKFSYDGQGYTYIDTTVNGVTYDRVIHDPEPGARRGRDWWEAGGVNGQNETQSDLCGIPGHEDKNWVQYHLWQIGSVFSEYEDCIMVVKGGIFGAWGEMHSSTYASTAAGYNWLINALLDYVPESRSILAHAGGAMAWQNVEYKTNYSFVNLPPAPVRGTRQQRIGMFNDSYSSGGSGSSPSDNGSLSEGNRLLSPTTYSRDGALTWIRNQMNFYGGESVSPSNTVYPRFPSVPYEAAYAHTSHLNTSWNQNTYRLWGDFVYNEANVTAPITYPHNGKTVTAFFDPMYDGRSGMEFMRDRLGYRLVMREANASEWAEQNGTLNFEGKIQNVGFGLIVNRKNVSVVLKAKDGGATYTALTDIDARDLLPAEDGNCRADNTAAYRDLNFSIDMSAFGEVPTGDYDIYLKLNDPKETSANRRCIRFANKGDIWDAAIGANLIGQTTVIYDKVKVSANVDAVSYINSDIDYTVSLENARDVLAVELEFEIDGDMLAGNGIVGLSGFDNLNNILWVHAGDNRWKGTVTLALPSGTTKGLTSFAPVDIAKFIFAPKGFGNAAMTLTSAKVVGLLDDTTKYVGSVIENGTATTIIARSKYDLNRDGTVDALDLGIMLLYCGFIEDTEDWGALVKVNDTWGNGVTASMCDVNSDGIIDMLDLLDLFIHYTK
ncbi:MAG: DUF4832 domain-containing protein [Clostridiales bacterium]|nr:DUF4832 domain-containing protein [Clostridiales bacterium]